MGVNPGPAVHRVGRVVPAACEAVFRASRGRAHILVRALGGVPCGRVRACVFPARGKLDVSRWLAECGAGVPRCGLGVAIRPGHPSQDWPGPSVCASEEQVRQVVRWEELEVPSVRPGCAPVASAEGW